VICSANWWNLFSSAQFRPGNAILISLRLRFAFSNAGMKSASADTGRIASKSSAVELTSSAMEIVGVAGDVYDAGPQEKPPTFAYWPALIENFEGEAVNVTRFAAFVVRTKRAITESCLTEARQAISSVDANLPVFRMQTLKDLYDQSLARTSFTLVMLATRGGMARFWAQREFTA
jgi:hypothetical protein